MILDFMDRRPGLTLTASDYVVSITDCPWILRVVQTKGILFLKSMSERVGSDIDNSEFE